MGKGKRFPYFSDDVLNENQLALEKEREEKQKDKQKETGQPGKEANTELIVQAMSQVSLRESEEIKNLKIEN